ncbi:MAG TPA: sigma-70 family RNA polymerase sigma factor [Lacipirellulaceae bacterium]|jgi:RNA polymerase sigma-70 factor (ECF subfamily)|nr:sigma-70 family RNA polymerase sigma factor [Lacipirellulaceae bacterium]
MNGPIDAELLGRLLDEHGAALALYASQWTAAAEDCVQEALVELARQRQAPDHTLAWLYRVVKNRALNAARGARRRRERESRAMSERFVGDERGAFDDDDTRAVIEALGQLDASERELIVMRIWGGLKYEEIAEALTISISSAHRQYERALVKLRTILETPCSTNANRQNPN